MDLIGNYANKKFMNSCLPSDEKLAEVDYVLAAIAYGSEIINPKGGLVDHCVENKLRLDLWMRYDHKVPVAIPLLEKLYRHLKNNVFTKFIPDRFHSKVIWWKGYGAYIGSANHTEYAWNGNLELGVFFTEDDLVKSGFDLQLEEYFEFLVALNEAVPISDSYIDEMRQLQKLQSHSTDAEKFRKTEIWGGPAFVNSKSAFDRKKDNFRKEWSNTLGILKTIEKQLIKYRPKWIADDVPSGWQVDQFLHAYYYNKVGDNHHKPYEDYFKNNRNDPNGALQTELNWWAGLQRAPSDEDITFNENAPLVRSLLSKNKIRKINPEEFQQVCLHTHATKDYLSKVSTADLGRPDINSLSRAERLPLFAELLLRERNSKGWDVRELLHYVLYGGPDENMWERLFQAGRDSDYSIRRYGLNSIAEVSGWTRPEVAPPRNGRTSKALRALGYDVKVY